MSIKRLASGKKIVSPNEDPGTLSVAMKLNAAVNRLSGAKNNVQNGISFVEVQDGVLETVGRIVGRMAELKGMATQDPMKSSQDVQSYNNEFVDLQKQLRDVSSQTFNGVSLFADFATGSDGSVTATQAEFRGNTGADNTIEIFTSSQGSTGTKISLYKSAVLSALTVDASNLTAVNTSGAGKNGNVFGLFADSSGATINLSETGLSMGVFEQALSNIAFLRAQTGGGMSRLTFAADSISSMETNLRSAIGRIEDVDIATESANLAKYSILTQASAAMVAQANSTSDIALMLLR
jgi:flagellin